MKASILLLLILIYNCKEGSFIKKKSRCRRGYGANQAILVVISFDGFKTEYLNSSFKTLQKKFEEGVKTEFDTLRFANALNIHHTIATGYFPNKHGVFAANWSTKENIVEKYQEKQYLNELTKKYKIVPIWTLNELNGGTSACMMWPGCEYRYGPENEMTTFHHMYNQTEDYNARLSKVIEWMNESVTLNPANLIMIYFEQPDKLAHVFGPNSSNVGEEIKKIDEFVKNFQTKLKLLKLLKRVDIIFLSDHRVIEIRYKDIIDIRGMGDCDDVGLWGSDVWLQQQYFSRTSGNNSQINGEWGLIPSACCNNTYTFYDVEKWNCDDNSYYCKNRRYCRRIPCFRKAYNRSKCLQALYELDDYKKTYQKICVRQWPYRYWPDIPHSIIANYTIIMAGVNYTFSVYFNDPIKITFAAYGEMLFPKIRNWSARYNFKVEKCSKFGVHGYGHIETGFFLAIGPSFIKNKTVQRFKVQDLFSLFARVLKIKGDFENDGKFFRVEPVLILSVLEKGKELHNWLESLLWIFICSIIHCIVFYAAVQIYLARKKRNRKKRKNMRKRQKKKKPAKDYAKEQNDKVEV